MNFRASLFIVDFRIMWNFNIVFFSIPIVEITNTSIVIRTLKK